VPAGFASSTGLVCASLFLRTEFDRFRDDEARALLGAEHDRLRNIWGSQDHFSVVACLEGTLDEARMLQPTFCATPLGVAGARLEAFLIAIASDEELFERIASFTSAEASIGAGFATDFFACMDVHEKTPISLIG
jgi:hypothetical protein